MNELIFSPGNPYPLGAHVVNDNTVNIAIVHNSDEAIGIRIYNRKSGEARQIDLDDNNRIGNIFCLSISGVDIENSEYTFIKGDEEYCDPYGKLIIGNEKWGVTPDRLSSAFINNGSAADYSNDRPLVREFSDSIIYELHVRGFTRHASSKVKYPGTFEGIVEKIPYLTGLGITAIELMPAYEFVELEAIKATEEGAASYEPYSPIEPKLNYWGYKEGYYFAPKASYSAKGVKPTDSFKNLVKELHKAGIEVIMQFYFPNTIKQAYILEVFKFWVREYHVDGFHMMGDHMPLTLIGTEPMLANTKFLYNNFPTWDIYGNSKPKYKNLAICNDDYMYTFRRFLKSDEGQVTAVIDGMRGIDDTLSRVHYITNCNGFTLMDMVSYDRKHNEDNGENNRDGNPYNASWNCGFEGPTTKRSVTKLRKIQIRNAICFNLLSQSTPKILAGDEFGNTQKGNNNPYCIDGPVTWLNWKDLDKHKDIYEFTKKMIELRKSNPILHMNRPFRMTDYCGNGTPDLSLHGEEAWKTNLDDLTRHFAMLYSTEYGYVDVNGKKLDSGKSESDYIYIMVNMHWTPHEFAIPNIPDKKTWSVLVDTSKETEDEILLKNSKKITIKDRSIIVLIGR